MEILETERDMETDEDMEEEEPMVFEVTEIDLEYEFDAARWYDFSREEELPSESRAAELWFETAQSYPPSPFTIKLLMREEFSDQKKESSAKSEDGEVQDCDREIDTGNGMKSGVLTFIQDGILKKVPNHCSNKGPTFSNGIHTDKQKSRTKSSTRPIPRSSTLMKPTASQLARQENIRLHMQVDQRKENGFCPSSVFEVHASKRQKLDGGLLRKVGETKEDMNFVHKALKKDGTLDRSARIKITIPQEPDFATSHRANRIRHKDDTKLDQDSTSVYRFKARPFNRKMFEAPSLPIRKKSTPKLPEFQEFRLKTSERAMQHSSATSYQGDNYHKPDKTAFLDGVNREPRRLRATDMPKEDDRKHIFKARLVNNKMLSSRREIGIFGKTKRETTIPLEFTFHSEKRVQPDLPTDLFSKLSLTSEVQSNGGCRLRFHQPEQVKGSKENRLDSFQAGNETSKVTGKLMVPETSRQWTARRSVENKSLFNYRSQLSDFLEGNVYCGGYSFLDMNGNTKKVNCGSKTSFSVFL